MAARRPAGAFVALGLAVSVVTCRGENPVVGWVRDNAVQVASLEPGSGLDDLVPLGEMIGGARVVFIGESRHNAREHFLFRRRLIELLCERHGFTAVALEEPLPNALALDRYVVTGEGDVDELLGKTGNWYIWDTQEMRGLVDWMRVRNAGSGSARRLRIYGLDITTPGVALRDVLAFLDKVDSAAGDAMRGRLPDSQLFDDADWTATMGRYAGMSDERRLELTAGFDELVRLLEGYGGRYVAASSDNEYEWALQEAKTIREANRLFSTARPGAPDPDDYRRGGLVREEAMADNLRWVLEREGREGRVIVLAHNVHVGRTPVDVAVPGRPVLDSIPSIALLLDDELGDSLFTIGCTYGSSPGEEPAGPDSATLDGVLAQAGMGAFVVGTRGAPVGGPVSEWLRHPQTMKAEGGFATCRPAETFDALLFVERLHRTTPGRDARLRLDAPAPDPGGPGEE